MTASRPWSTERADPSSAAVSDGPLGGSTTVAPAGATAQQPLDEPALRHLMGRGNLASVYFTDRGLEELAARRGEEEVSLEWLADQLRTFVDLNPEFETPIERLATWLARLDDDED